MPISDSVTLEYNMTPGEVLRYKSTVHSQQTIKAGDDLPEELESNLEIVMDQKVLSVNNGIAKVEVTIVDGSITRGADVYPLDSIGQKLTMDMKRNGDVVATSVNFPFSQPAFPSQPLLPGDNWQTTNPMNMPNGNDGATKTVDLHYTHTLARFDHRNGYDVAVIDVVCPKVAFDLQDGIHQTIVADGQTNFAHSLGRLVSSNVHTHTEIIVPDTTVITDLNVSVELAEARNNNGGAATFGSADEQFIIGLNK